MLFSLMCFGSVKPFDFSVVYADNVETIQDDSNEGSMEECKGIMEEEVST